MSYERFIGEPLTLAELRDRNDKFHEMVMMDFTMSELRIAQHFALFDWYIIRQALIDAGYCEGVQPVIERDPKKLMMQRGQPATEVIPWGV